MAIAKKAAAKKSVPAAKKVAPKSAPAKPAKAAPAKPAKAAPPVKPAKGKRPAADLVEADPTLFEPLTQGERADALRVLLEDRRVASMAKVGRYRVVAADALVVKPPEAIAGRRLCRLVIQDYAGDLCVDACVDLDRSMVSHLAMSTTQPLLAPEEESAAVAIAMNDERVKQQLSLGDEPQAALHYWSRHSGDLAYRRRSAAVLFGPAGSQPTVVAVVDLVDSVVSETVPADKW